MDRWTSCCVARSRPRRMACMLWQRLVRVPPSRIPLARITSKMCGRPHDIWAHRGTASSVMAARNGRANSVPTVETESRERRRPRLRKAGVGLEHEGAGEDGQRTPEIWAVFLLFCSSHSGCLRSSPSRPALTLLTHFLLSLPIPSVTQSILPSITLPLLPPCVHSLVSL